MKHIILASSSPRRKTILESVGLKFEVVPSMYEEDNDLPMPTNQLVMHLALGKAKSVFENHPESLVIGSDMLAVIDGKVIGKVYSKEQLIDTFRLFSGRSHSVFSGIAIIEHGRELTDWLETKVFFRDLSEQEIERYAEHTEEWQDKMGGYGIQGLASLFIDKIEGDYYSVVGLPLCRLGVLLKKFGVDIL
ncbi:MAG TPA: Maf family protein [Patescibacteria group bacterium]|nr:Maf family protein [Patescibacteria group bacterium]